MNRIYEQLKKKSSQNHGAGVDRQPTPSPPFPKFRGVATPLFGAPGGHNYDVFLL